MHRERSKGLCSLEAVRISIRACCYLKAVPEAQENTAAGNYAINSRGCCYLEAVINCSRGCCYLEAVLISSTYDTLCTGMVPGGNNEHQS